jgi:hypothetical protein
VPPAEKEDEYARSTLTALQWPDANVLCTLINDLETSRVIE